MRSDSETHSPATVDFADIKFAVVMVVVGLTLFFTKNFVPDAGLNRYVTDIIASFCCVAYILHRARRHPERLDEWGLTTRLSPTGRIAGAGLVVLAFAGPATLAFILGGRLSFSLSMVVSGLGGLRAGIPTLLHLGECARPHPAFPRRVAGAGLRRGRFRARPSITGRFPLAPHPFNDGLHRSGGLHGGLLLPPVPQPLAHRRVTRHRIPHAHHMDGPDYPYVGLTLSHCHRW